jgi:hypothetical protein
LFVRPTVTKKVVGVFVRFFVRRFSRIGQFVKVVCFIMFYVCLVIRRI